ncbi:MAG: histidine kinase [Bacteroidota bacterium]
MAWAAYSAAGEYGECIAISNTLGELIGPAAPPMQKALLYFIRENAYRQQGDFEKAVEYNLRNIEQLELARDTQGLVSAIISKAFYAYYVDEDIDETFAILDTLVGQEDQYSHNLNRYINGEYGVYLFFEGLYQRALESYQKGLHHIHQMEAEPNLNVYLATFYSNIAEAHIQLKDFNNAQVFLDSVHQLGLESIPEGVRNSTLRYQLELVYRNRQGLGPIMSALDSILWYQDQQFLRRNESDLRALQIANEKEKKLLEQNKQEELQNLRLRSRQTLLLVLFTIIILLGYLLYRQRQLHFEKQELQLHQRLLRAQMNPHFTFNTLSAIQNLISKNPQKAISYQLKFSRLLRLILKNSTANFVQLDDELTTVEGYLELQLLRFPGKFDYKIVLEGIERDSLNFIPPMLIQPMIENCIEHGFANIDYKGLITITLSKGREGFLFCSIKDNGVGIPVDRIDYSKAKSTKLIDSFLKKLTPRGLSLSNNTARTTGEKGALVEFLIPCKNAPNG